MSHEILAPPHVGTSHIFQRSRKGALTPQFGNYGRRRRGAVDSNRSGPRGALHVQPGRCPRCSAPRSGDPRARAEGQVLRPRHPLIRGPSGRGEARLSRPHGKLPLQRSSNTRDKQGQDRTASPELSPAPPVPPRGARSPARAAGRAASLVRRGQRPAPADPAGLQHREREARRLQMRERTRLGGVPAPTRSRAPRVARRTAPRRVLPAARRSSKKTRISDPAVPRALLGSPQSFKGPTRAFLLRTGPAVRCGGEPGVLCRSAARAGVSGTPPAPP